MQEFGDFFRPRQTPSTQAFPEEQQSALDAQGPSLLLHEVPLARP